MAGGAPYTDEECEFLARHWAAGKTNDEVYELYVARFGKIRSLAAIAAARTKSSNVAAALAKWEERVAESIPERVRRALAGEHVPGVTVGHPPTEIEEPRKPQYYDPALVWERVKRETRAAKEWQTKRHYVTVKVASARPIGVSFASDHHLNESAAVDMDRMEDDAKVIRDTPGLYICLGGDGVDNHIKHRAAMVNSSSRPSTEYLLFDHYLGWLGHKVLALVSGNHDDWTSDMAGVDMVSRIAQRHRMFYAPDFVVITLQIVDPKDVERVTAEYKIKVRHQYRYGSSFNQTHTVKRMWEMDQDDFDIGVVCHHHEAAYEPFSKHGLERLAFRPGSYKVTDGHSRRYGHKPAHATCPTAILWPDRRRLTGFRDVWEAVDYLRYLRDRDDNGLEAPERTEAA